MSRETLEIELSGDALRALIVPQRTQPSSTNHVGSQPSLAVKSGGWRSGAIAIAALTSVLIAYRFASTSEPVVVGEGLVADVSTVPESPMDTSTIEAPPVKFANPFDPGEVFEFPAGTSEEQARESVADLLRERAQARSAG